MKWAARQLLVSSLQQVEARLAAGEVLLLLLVYCWCTAVLLALVACTACTAAIHVLQL
jgi:hypothetical protein